MNIYGEPVEHHTVRHPRFIGGPLDGKPVPTINWDDNPIYQSADRVDDVYAVVTYVRTPLLFTTDRRVIRLVTLVHEEMSTQEAAWTVLARALGVLGV